MRTARRVRGSVSGAALTLLALLGGMGLSGCSTFRKTSSSTTTTNVTGRGRGSPTFTPTTEPKLPLVRGRLLVGIIVPAGTPNREDVVSRAHQIVQRMKQVWSDANHGQQQDIVEEE